MTSPINTTPDPARWRWHALVMTVFVAVFLGRFAWPPLQTEAIASLGITNAEAGLFMNTFYMGYMATQLPGGMLSDRFGAKIVLAASLFISGLATLMIYTITTAEAGYFWRVVAGLGSGAVYSSCVKATVAGFPRAELGKAFGLMMMAPTLGTLIPNQLAPRLSLALGGWRPTFMAIGLGLLMLGLLFVIIFPARRSGGPAASGGASASPWTGLKFVLGDGRLRLLCAIGFCLLWGFLGFVSWGNQYLILELGYSRMEAGHIMTTFGLVGLATTFGAGVLTDKVRSKEMLLALAYAAIIAGLIAFPIFKGAAGLAAAAGLVGAGVGASNAILAVLTSLYAGPRWAATAGGATGTIFQSAGMFVPFVLGWTVDLRGNYDLVWPLLAAPQVLAIIMIIFMVRIKPVDSETA
ncbi:hypothetical protein C4J81_05085 [Deltaproteobacteria bacterium Smac51]|nr:hypothetical protein C4J81_05085 [Deltaproteobacteria bacterium Smac51]